ncbi:enoyl-CoA hydratase-related protein [Bradyrhizobium sp. 141]|uniref:enoyl-CoA hydratase-related protein n=1 Tax=Bradyrhizobium sp. 141 TaxID=2782617 RepID=UPI001FF72140|nr:enoyl-CoA hydratase-related protein [Bradyrhizobium sp. 141]MCK1723763.1 enoyl-CoA hydratase/isomerase family protein [Bradyrhizobium sp. 141]
MTERQELDTGTNELLAEIRDGVAVLTLNRPEARNALTDPMIRAWRGLIQRVGDDPRVVSILVTGAGATFCAGGDVKSMSKSATAAEATFDERVAALCDEQRAVIGALVTVRKPTVAAIAGPAAGAGLALALACDMRIAAQSAIMTTAYARIALAGDYGITWLLSRVVGYARARELLLLSERITSERAEALGLVNRVVPDADLPDLAFQLAASLAEGAPVAFRLIKDNLEHAVNSSLVESLDYEARNHIMAKLTLDYKEGVRAFSEKRKASFGGR